MTNLRFRYPLQSDWLLYLFLLSYGYLIASMTYGLWFGGGVNIFASYSEPADPVTAITDANKVYWSKTCFLFGTILLVGFNVDFRAALGIGATFWSVSLIAMFGVTPVLATVLVMGAALVALQVWRKALFCTDGRRV